MVEDQYMQASKNMEPMLNHMVGFEFENIHDALPPPWNNVTLH